MKAVSTARAVGTASRCFGQDAGQWGVGAEGGAQVGFDEAVDEQGDADDGDEGVDAVVVVQEDRPHVQGLFEVAVALFDDPLVFVDVEHVERGQCALGWVGQVGGEGVEPVEGRRRR